MPTWMRQYQVPNCSIAAAQAREIPLSRHNRWYILQANKRLSEECISESSGLGLGNTVKNKRKIE